VTAAQGSAGESSLSFSLRVLEEREKKVIGIQGKGKLHSDLETYATGGRGWGGVIFGGTRTPGYDEAQNLSREAT